ncbi:MAG: hypothetical protein M3046_15115 [Actinomycetota bacterium]|nr:hypothetical protein [Actinomycetota bacterium]
MELYHATDEAGAHGIMKHGFAVSHLADSPKPAWLCSTKESATTGSAEGDWLVIVDMPQEVAEEYRHRFDDGTAYLDNYLIPWDVVNAYVPFRYERCRPG